MATGTIPSPPPKGSAPIKGRYEDFIQKRLEQTRRQVRLVDFGSGIVLLLAASLFFFLLVALADHWLFAHGLNFFARLLLFGAWLTTAGWFTWRAVAPSVIHRINPVFAAQAIENGRPTLKNSLINFLLLRSHPENVAPVVYYAMEHRAATDLSRVPIDQAVDHRRFIHLCYALAASVVLFALYLALSPKNPLVSAARVIWPFAALPAPTRVHIEDVQPGDKIIYQGDRLEVSAHVAGLRDSEQVSLLMSTADGQVVDDRVTMNRTGEDDRYACALPPGSGGLLQTTSYRINAGDATTRPFKLEVEIAPTINVERVDYHFPAYTGIKDRSIKGQGDIKALEGTRVTIHATSNVDLAKAKIDLGCTGLGMIPMSLSGKQATGEFTLAGAQEPNKAWKPLFDRYQIILTDSEDHSLKQHPIQYRIDVDRDYPPELSIVEPKEDTVDLAAGGHLLIRFRASDDFGLRHIGIKAERNGLPLDLPTVLDRVSPEKAFAQPYDGDFDFVATAFHLMKGDEVKYWVEADDNKEPMHNHAETARRTIRIVDEQDPKRAQANQQKQDASKDKHGEGQQQPGKSGGEKGDGKSDNSSQDGASKGETSPQSKGGRDGDPSKSNDPAKADKSNANKPEKKDNPGKDGASPDPKNGESDTSAPGTQGSKRSSDSQKADAMKDIVKDMEKQQKEKQKNQPSGEGSQPGQQQDQTNQGGNQEGNPQGASPQNAGQSNQSGKDDKSPQGGRGGQQPQGASADKSKPGGESGDPQPSGNNQTDPSAKNAPGQESKPDAESGSGQAKEKTSPPSGDNTQQPGGSPQGSPKQENQSGTGQASPQSAGSQQGKDQSKTSAGPKKEGGSAGAESKQETKQPSGGKSPEQSASGDPKSDKKKATGGEQGGSQSGANQLSADKKPSGSEGGENNNQLAMKSGDSAKKNPSQGGSSASRDTPGGSSKPDKAPKPQSNNAGGGGQNSPQQKQEQKEQSSGGAGGQEQPKPGGEQPQPGEGKSSASGSKTGKPGDMADDGPGQKDPGRDGAPTDQTSGKAPAPQLDSAPGEKKVGDSNSTGQKPNDAQSPGNSEKTSESKGESQGDRRGGGAGGGGGDQHSNKNGKGTPGSHSVGGEDGGKVSDEKGPGATGSKAGEAARTTDNTASPRKEPGTGDKTQPSDKQGTDESQNKSDNTKPDNTAQNSNQTPQGAGGQTGAASSQQPGQRGAGQPAGGSQAGNQPPAPPSKSSAEADEADQKFAKSQVDMALRHLKDETSKPKSDLLDRLGWTPEEAKKFAENIEKLRDSANQPGSEGDASKKAYNEFLKDLGLRPHGTRIEGGKTRADNFRGVHDAVQMDPPAEWEDIARGYSQKTAAGQK